jgi:pentatricopeptide repeat protein
MHEGKFWHGFSAFVLTAIVAYEIPDRLQETRRLNGTGVDGVVVNAVSWPARNKRGQRIDTTPFLEELLGTLEADQLYKAGSRVWMDFVKVAAKGAYQNEVRWKLVRRAFRNLSSCHPSYHPGVGLLKDGLAASESLRDPILAAELVTKVLDREQRGTSKLPSKDIVRGMEICVNSGDLNNARMLLDRCNTLSDRIQQPILRQLYTLVLKGYAAKGDPQSAETLLDEMLHKSLEVR